ncbi:MAG: helix-turn-helix domain-containing protein [Candidatus Thorarchaeota archaeon]|jgi:DNA-binding transcriptional ArsR family regulator
MNDLLSVSKALSNPTRVRILEYLLTKRVANKGDVMEELGLERAALEHHLKPLVDAKIVSILDVVIDKVKNSLLFPIASVSLDRSPEISADTLKDVIGAEIESDVNHDEIQEKAQAEVKAGHLDQEDAVAIVRTLFEHRGRGTKNMCSVCGRIRKMADLALCERCFRPACTNCNQTIQRDDGASELLCDRCVNQLFS